MMSERISITDIVEFNPKRTVKKGTVAPFIEMAALPTSQRDVDYVLQKELKSGGAKFTNGDTLFARITPCLENGKTALVSGLKENINGFGSTEFIVMSPKYPEYDSKFIYYLARHPEFRDYAKAHMEGTSGRQRVSWQSLSEFKYSFPEKDERKKIGDLLSKLDDKISNNSAMNATLEKIAQRIFKSWFVDFDPVKANAEGVPFDGLSSEIQALFPNEFEGSELGMIPKGWDVKNIEHFIESLSKGTTPTKNDLSSATDLPLINYLKVRDINDSGLINSELDKIPASIHVTKLKRSILKTNDLVVSIAGTIGRVTVIPEWLNNSNCNQAVCFIRLPEESSYHDYIRVLLTQKSTQEYFYSSVVQGVQANISLAVVKNTPVITPTEGVIKSWKKIIDPVIKKIDLNNSQNNCLTKIRDKLLPRLISGKITINKAEELLEKAS